MADNDELNKSKKILEEQVEVAGHLDNAFKSIAANMAVAFKEVIDGMRGVDEIGAKIAKSYERDIVSSIRKMSGGLENQLGLQLKIEKGQNVSKEIEEQINKAKARALLTSEKIKRAEGLGVKEKKELRKQLDGQLTQELETLKILEKNNKERQNSKGLAEVVNDNVKSYADTLDKTGTLSAILSGNLKEVMTDTKIVELAFVMIAKAAIKANTSITQIQKSLGVGSGYALLFRLELSGAAFAANDLRVSTESLLLANKALNQEYQTAAVFNKDILVGAASALDAQIMSGKAISQLAGDAARLGQTFDESLKTQQDAVNAINSQTGAQINLQTVLEASNKVSGQIRAQLGSNPEAIARAVTQAKALGFELEQIANSGKQLLQFESSIGAELEAELLTGKQLNLEKARLAALTGDYETLTAEIAANVGDFNDFSQMNVLQQEAIAKAVGMTADDLANSLVTEENREQLLKDAIASGNEQSVLQLKALDTQEKFAKMTMQIKGVFVDMFQVLSPIVDAIGLIAEGMGTFAGKGMTAIAIMVGLVKVSRSLKALSIASSISTIWQSFAKIPYGLGIPLAVAATAGLMGAINRYSKADDMMYGDNMLVTKNKGAIALNNDDTIIAGTNLGGGSGRRRRDDGEPGWLRKLISGINSKEVRFDSYAASGPQGIVNTERRQPSNLFD